MDTRTRYRRLNDSVFRLYAGGRQTEALRRIADNADALSHWSSELAYLTACLHGSLGDHDAAVRTLADAIAENAWWDPDILHEDEDLAGARELPGFDVVLEASRRRWREHTSVDDRSGDVLAEPSDPARAVLVALHGAEQNADDAMAAWKPALRCGVAVHAVRSSQRASPRYRNWRDHPRAAGELTDAHRTLPDHLRGLPVIAAGFSAGGRVALRWAACGDPYPVAGMVAVAPAVAPEDVPAGDGCRPSPARILIGSEDDLLDGVAPVAERLREHGFAIEVVPALGHAFPGDFATRLTTLLHAFA